MLRSRLVAVGVIASILAALLLGMGAAGCMSDSEDHSEAKQAALKEIGLAKQDLTQLEESLPSSSPLADYVDQSGIRSSVEDLGNEIENAELLLRDPSEYEFVNGFEVGDFELGLVIAQTNQFREQVAALRDRLDVAENHLDQIAALEDELESLADSASSGEFAAEIKRVQADLAALKRV
jgi:DNA repair exonuclease SbcCD ATPase subunit